MHVSAVELVPLVLKNNAGQAVHREFKELVHVSDPTQFAIVVQPAHCRLLEPPQGTVSY